MPQIITLGTALLDEFRWVDSPAGQDVEGALPSLARPNEIRIGGGGVYAALGARIWLPPSQIGCILHRGPDFPVEVQELLNRYGEEMWYYIDVETPTPRALNTYHPPSPTRHFQLLTPPPPLLPSSFPSSSQPTWIHACCTPSHLSSLLSSFASTPTPTHANLATPSPAKVVYEPLPPSCLPSSLPLLTSLFSHPSFYLLSPNHFEAASLLGLPASSVSTRTGVEEVASKLLELGAGRVVVRCGAWGSFWMEQGEESGWVGAYWGGKEGEVRVRDTVGAGNAFLGGLLASLSLFPSLRVGAHFHRASISASFIVEQVGFPTLSISLEGEERWNGASAEERLEELRERSADGE